MRTKQVTVPIQHITTSHSNGGMLTGVPNYYSSLEPAYGHNFPLWRLNVVTTMLRDSRVSYGLILLKGPIKAFTVFLPEDQADSAEVHQSLRENGTQFAYTVKCDDSEVNDFVLKTLNKFWEDGLEEYLTCIEWGYSCNQVIYKFDSNKDGKPDLSTIEYDKLVWYNPLYVQAMTKDDKLIGACIKGPNQTTELMLYIPKLLWGIHNKRVNRLFGQSRLFGCFIPWHETWTTAGARDIRRIWFQKNSFDSGELRYPPGKTTLSDGTVEDNRDTAVKIMANIRSGGGRVLPNSETATGNKQWEYTPPAANVTPQGLMEYPDQLREEILEGLGIPPEVVESSSDSGFGSATGRKVPMTVYYSTLSNIVSSAINTFDEQCIKYLVRMRFKKDVPYTIEKVVPLKSEMGMKQGQTDVIDKTVQGENLSD